MLLKGEAPVWKRPVAQVLQLHDEVSGRRDRGWDRANPAAWEERRKSPRGARNAVRPRVSAKAMKPAKCCVSRTQRARNKLAGRELWGWKNAPKSEAEAASHGGGQQIEWRRGSAEGVTSWKCEPKVSVAMPSGLAGRRSGENQVSCLRGVISFAPARREREFRASCGYDQPGRANRIRITDPI